MVYFNTMYGPLRETAARHRNDAKTPRPSSRSRGAIANTSDFENDRPRPRPPLESRQFRKRAAPSQEFRRETQTSGSRFRKRLFSQRVADERLASASASAAAMAALALALASFVAALDSFGGWRRPPRGRQAGPRRAALPLERSLFRDGHTSLFRAPTGLAGSLYLSLSLSTLSLPLVCPCFGHRLFLIRVEAQPGACGRHLPRRRPAHVFRPAQAQARARERALALARTDNKCASFQPLQNMQNLYNTQINNYVNLFYRNIY